MRDALRKPVRKYTHGGARPGAGRKPKGEKAGERHCRRREIDARHPVHVTLRVAKNDAVGKDRGCEARRGRVFSDRYHAEVMDSPRKCRNGMAYVINNWRRHGEDRGHVERRAQVDPYSSGVSFDGWAGREGRQFVVPEGYEALPVAAPTSWLLRVGWRRAGEIDVREVPGREPRSGAGAASAIRGRITRGRRGRR